MTGVSMAQAERIFILDLHNTLYDEVIEYGNSVAAAVAYFLQVAKQQGMAIDEALCCEQLSQAHAHLGSDWDDDVWGEAAELRKLDNFAAIRDMAVAIRRKTSEHFTRTKAYAGTLDALRKLKTAGHTVYVATEATGNAAADGIRWLGLDGVLDGVYAWPFTKPYEKPSITPVGAFPPNPHHTGFSLQKPHPLILGTIVLDHAKKHGAVPATATAEEVFDLTIDGTLDVGALKRGLHANPAGEKQKAQAAEALRAIQTTLAIKDGPYREALEAVRQRCYYVGDSFFKDGFVARNAGIPYVFAQYGKTVAEADKADHSRGKDWLFRVTGWDKYLIELTQEAGKLPELTEKIKPCFVCEKSFQEFVDFLG